VRAFIFVAILSVCALDLDLAKLSADEPSGAAATIRVALPDDATLTVDGQATRSGSAIRWFVTPPLESGKRYFYSFRADFVRGGKTIAVEQKVPVRAGRETVVSLDASGTGSAAVLAPGARAYYYYTPGPAGSVGPRPSYYPAFPAETSSYRGYSGGGFRPDSDPWRLDLNNPFSHNGQ